LNILDFAAVAASGQIMVNCIYLYNALLCANVGCVITGGLSHGYM